MAERKSIPNDSILITNLCIDPVVRGLGIGYELVNRYIDMMEKRGYRSFRLDCLEDNIPARQMYNKLGFQEIGGGYGFSGPKQTEPKILHLLLEF
jgi:ribosomal protein S18 acetylase RimI-like enzyme